MSVATTSNEANAADGPFSTACPDLTRRRTGVGYSHVWGEVMGSEIERLTVPVRGMHCAACAGKVEGALRGEEGEREQRLMRWKLTVGALLSAPVLVGGMGDLLPWAPAALRNPWVQLLLATPVQFWVGSQFHSGFIRDLRYLAASMSTLVSIGTNAAYFFSVAVTLWPHAFMRAGGG